MADSVAKEDIAALVHLPREMTSEERAQQFQTNKMSLLLIG